MPKLDEAFEQVGETCAKFTAALAVYKDPTSSPAAKEDARQNMIFHSGALMSQTNKVASAITWDDR